MLSLAIQREHGFLSVHQISHEKKKQINVNTKCSLMLRLQASSIINNSPILALKKIFRLLPCWVFLFLSFLVTKLISEPFMEPHTPYLINPSSCFILSVTYPTM